MSTSYTRTQARRLAVREAGGVDATLRSVQHVTVVNRGSKVVVEHGKKKLVSLLQATAQLPGCDPITVQVAIESREGATLAEELTQVLPKAICEALEMIQTRFAAAKSAKTARAAGRVDAPPKPTLTNQTREDLKKIGAPTRNQRT